MTNKWVLVFLGVLGAQLCMAQENDLQVMGISPNLYITHTIQAKETWYSEGRTFNVTPKQLALYNNLTIDKPLAIGQTIKVPLTADNFSQDGNKAASEVFVPIRHTIQEKEWLYRVSMNYNKVPVESLEKWNGINKDQAKAGLKLIVGYLKVKQGQSALPAQGSAKVEASSPVAAADKKEPEEKKQITSVPATDNADRPAAKATPPAKEETKPIVTPVVNTSSTASGNGAKLSYFSSSYEETGKSVSGNAGIFKSTSGWNDGKYYALVNNVAVGTIVKVNNPVSGKTIYAKVLGNLPDMKESAGLVARLSDAAAAQVEANGIKFSVEVRY